jgi:hypothetical protein
MLFARVRVDEIAETPGVGVPETRRRALRVIGRLHACGPQGIEVEALLAS